MATVEHELLRYLAEKGEAPLRDAVSEFGAKHGITRGTIVKMADRLFKKGLLKRRLVDHKFLYSPSEQIEDIESSYVQKFVESRLNGDVAPLLAFLSEQTSLTDEDRAHLQSIAQRLAEEK